MHLKKIEINGYRNFNKTTISFEEGINIIIGPNNAGKSNLLKVISFLDNSDSSASIHDFNKNDIVINFENYKKQPPKIEILYHIEHVVDLNTFDDGILKFKNFIVYNEDGKAISDKDEKYILQAIIKLNYELDEKYFNDYYDLMRNIHSFEDFMNAMEKIISRYSWNYYNTTSNTSVKKTDVTSIFNIDFIAADRQTEKTLPKTKKFVEDTLKQTDEKIDLKHKINKDINDDLKFVTDEISDILAKDEESIGLADSNNVLLPRFNYDSPFQNYFELSLKDKNLNYEIPMDSNGLGYNNLIQIYGIIKLKIDNDYNLLLIEEPEAHLHPAMQYKLFNYLSKLKTLDEIKEDNGEVQEDYSNRIIKNQIFVTTHSPNITASAKIDDMISIFYYQNKEQNLFEVNAVNLKNQFICVDDEIQNQALQLSKNHLAKFLDVTRSDLLFTQKTILVEGLAEKLLFSAFAKKCGLNYEIEHNHISIVEVGGITFNHFAPLFYNTKNKLLCFRDNDFNYYDTIIDSNGNKSIEMSELKKYRNHIKKIKLHSPYNTCQNIQLFTQMNYGSTFENELFLDNFENTDVLKSLVKFVFPKNLINFVEVQGFSIKNWTDNNSTIKCKKTKEKVNNLLNIYCKKYNQSNDSIKSIYEKLFFANLFLDYAKSAKGDLALNILTSNIMETITVPQYIQEGLKWIKIK